MSSDPVLNRAPVSPKHSTSEALQAILQANLDYFMGWQPYAYEGVRMRGVHQTRVSFRRSRSALTVFRKALPRAVALPTATGLKTVAGEMGPARDMDVFIAEGIPDVSEAINNPEGEEKLRAIAQGHKETAYVAVRAMFDGDHYPTFIKEYQAWINDQGWLKDENMTKATRKQMKSPVTKFAPKVLERRFNKIMAQAGRMSEMSEEEMHDLRKDCKKMRYATEFFTPLYNVEEVAEFTARFKAVQKLLGLINDVAVMPSLLEQLLDGVEDAQIKDFAQQLSTLRRGQQDEAKQKLLGGVWKELEAVKRPWKK